jgi:hypothetical protein
MSHVAGCRRSDPASSISGRPGRERAGSSPIYVQSGGNRTRIEPKERGRAA